jgi:DNA polymerase V
MIQAAREVLDKTYKDGLKYAKAGVMLSGICEYAETMSDLFEMPDEKAQVESEKLIAVMDEINQQLAHARPGRATTKLFLASTGIAKQQDWQMNRAFLSPSYTTKLSDLLTVH